MPNRKKRVYTNDCAEEDANFIPAAQENYGRMHDDYMNLLKTASARITDNLPGQSWATRDPLTYYLQKLAVARVNAFDFTMRAKARAALERGAPDLTAV